jgi:hypothetical protein
MTTDGWRGQQGGPEAGYGTPVDDEQVWTLPEAFKPRADIVSGDPATMWRQLPAVSVPSAWQALFPAPDRTADRATTAAAPSPAEVAASFALAQLGDSYVWGAEGPDAWDCSALVQAAWAAAGVTLPRVSADQYAHGVRAGWSVPRDDVRRGDLVFFRRRGVDGVGHVGLALGDGRVLHASSPRRGVIVSEMSGMPYVGATRPPVGGSVPPVTFAPDERATRRAAAVAPTIAREASTVARTWDDDQLACLGRLWAVSDLPGSAGARIGTTVSRPWLTASGSDTPAVTTAIAAMQDVVEIAGEHGLPCDAWDQLVTTGTY